VRVPEASSLHSHYYDRKGITAPDAQGIVAAQRGAEYRAFGFVAAMMGYVPVLNFFTALSNSVGAALWAAQLEKTAALVKKRR
jgi:hypothetical protein